MSGLRKWENLGGVVRTHDHPEAGGRQPLPGEVEYPLTFTLDTGETLTVRMGQRGFDTVTDLLVDMLSNASPHDDDGSLARRRVARLSPTPLTDAEVKTVGMLGEHLVGVGLCRRLERTLRAVRQLTTIEHESKEEFIARVQAVLAPLDGA